MIRSNGSNASKLESNGKKGSCHAGSIGHVFLEAERPLRVEAVWKLKNFISISANESTDFLHFRMSKTFPAKNDLNPPNRAFKAFFALISPRKKGSSAQLNQPHLNCHL